MKNENDDDVMLREGKREGFYCKRQVGNGFPYNEWLINTCNVSCIQYGKWGFLFYYSFPHYAWFFYFILFTLFFIYEESFDKYSNQSMSLIV
jgi:hypothetical protein